MALRTLLVILVGSLFLSLAHAQEESAEGKSINEFIRTYFKSWSEVDFVTYRSLFHPAATVHTEGNGRWSQWELQNFLSAQEQMQKASRSKEFPRTLKIKARQGGLVFVETFWELQRADGDAVTGYDWFTLVKTGDSWKILNLVFWQEAAPGSFLIKPTPPKSKP